MSGKSEHARLGVPEDLLALVRARQPQVGVESLLDRRVAAGSAEDEHDRGQQALGVEPVHHVDPTRDEGATRRAPVAPVLGAVVARPGALPVVAGHPGELRVDRHVVAPARAAVREQVEHLPTDHDVLEQRNWAPLLDDDVALTSHRAQPVAELLRVGHRRRQRHDAHRLGQVDDHLFPHGAAGSVGQVVHLVHHDEPQSEERPRPGVQHVAQHLGGHHHDRSVAVDGVVAGQEADVLGAVPPGEVSELLVGERLDRRRVEALAAVGQRQVDGELPYQRLAGASGRRDEDSAAGEERLTRAQLESVEREVVQRDEVSRHGHASTLMPAARIRSRRLGRPRRSPGAARAAHRPRRPPRPPRRSGRS